MAASAHLAIYNFGIHVDEFGSEAVQGFSLREPANFKAAERAPGFIARSGYDGEPGPPSWGPQVFPRFLAERGGGAAVSSLSLWRDIESLMAFAYTGVHANALKYARRWNVVQDWPPLVMFWVAAGHRPDWQEGVARFEMLVDQGCGPQCFTFKQAYSPDGAPAVIDRSLVKERAAANAAVQGDLLETVLNLPV
ncbi:DUF3291 domain-containing protein [Peteryoungia ipomoeae]|uniref:DUF3291 domain-containing protein n=1 Tax=Peteryoungia ipomoeae TaxID=1210932 RepID=A0A4S8P1F5_9HYPH|nr:DUF3291 domain-containing protein [Peteryoungia ipomoeae]THV22512.1 DUF3291 domain-containing protein [Peteryoungia ipomoeae]